MKNRILKKILYHEKVEVLIITGLCLGSGANDPLRSDWKDWSGSGQLSTGRALRSEVILQNSARFISRGGRFCVASYSHPCKSQTNSKLSMKSPDHLWHLAKIWFKCSILTHTWHTASNYTGTERKEVADYNVQIQPMLRNLGRAHIFVKRWWW